jgi:transposase-like protein
MKAKKPKLEIRQPRIFSEEFKKSKVRELVEKKITVIQLCSLYHISRTSVYNWLYQYSPHHSQRTTLVVQMESESHKTKRLLEKVAELERIVGQKQIEIDFLNKVLEVGSTELGFDLKKNFSTPPSNGGAGNQINQDPGK